MCIHENLVFLAELELTKVFNRRYSVRPYFFEHQSKKLEELVALYIATIVRSYVQSRNHMKQTNTFLNYTISIQSLIFTIFLCIGSNNNPNNRDGQGRARC